MIKVYLHPHNKSIAVRDFTAKYQDIEVWLPFDTCYRLVEYTRYVDIYQRGYRLLESSDYGSIFPKVIGNSKLLKSILKSVNADKEIINRHILFGVV